MLKIGYLWTVVQTVRSDRVAQSVGHLTRKSEVLGSISFLLIQEGLLSVTGESQKVCARSTG